MYPIYPTSLVPLMTFSFPIICTVDTSLKVLDSRVTALYHPLSISKRGRPLLNWASRAWGGHWGRSGNLMHDGDNNTGRLLRGCCVLQFHWALYGHCFMDSCNLTRIHNEHLHFPQEISEAQKINQPFPRSSNCLVLDRGGQRSECSSPQPQRGGTHWEVQVQPLVVKVIENMGLQETPETTQLHFRFPILIMQCAPESCLCDRAQQV